MVNCNCEYAFVEAGRHHLVVYHEDDTVVKYIRTLPLIYKFQTAVAFKVLLAKRIVCPQRSFHINMTLNFCLRFVFKIATYIQHGSTTMENLWNIILSIWTKSISEKNATKIFLILI